MTDVELTIQGEIEVLRLQPGDIIVATVTDRLTEHQIALMVEQIRARFPDHEVVVCEGVELSTVRP